MVHLKSHCMLGQAYAGFHASGKNFNLIESEKNTGDRVTAVKALYLTLSKGSLEVKARLKCITHVTCLLHVLHLGIWTDHSYEVQQSFINSQCLVCSSVTAS